MLIVKVDSSSGKLTYAIEEGGSTKHDQAKIAWHTLCFAFRTIYMNDNTARFMTVMTSDGGYLTFNDTMPVYPFADMSRDPDVWKMYSIPLNSAAIAKIMEN